MQWISSQMNGLNPETLKLWKTWKMFSPAANSGKFGCIWVGQASLFCRQIRNGYYDFYFFPGIRSLIRSEKPLRPMPFHFMDFIFELYPM
jgi:hypothetical protein